MGDIIIASGLPHYIKRKEPDSKVIIIRGSGFRGIFDNNPHVDIDVSYEKETRETQPSLPELCKRICEMAAGEEKVDIHFADLQTNKRSYALLYLFKQYLRKDLADSEVYLSQVEIEKYRGAKMAMVWGNFFPLFISRKFGNSNTANGDKKSNAEKLNESISQLSGRARRGLKLRKMLQLPYINQRYFDAVYGKGTVKRRLKGGKNLQIRPELWSKEDLGAAKYLPAHRAINKGLKSVGIFPGAAHRTKMWPANYFATLAELLLENGMAVVLLGSKNDESLINKIVERCKYKGIEVFLSEGGLQDTVAKVSKMDAIVSNDSAGAHIAHARRIRAFVIFGSTVPELGFAPKSPAFRIIEDNTVPCRPCTHIGRDRCPRGHFDCMENILPDAIYKQIHAYFCSDKFRV